MVDHHIGCDLTRDASALIIMPDIVGVQAVRDGISLDADAGEQRRLSANRDFFVTFGHCIKGHNLSSLDFNDKSSEFLFVEIHCTLRQGSQIPFVVTSGQKSRPSKNIGSIP